MIAWEELGRARIPGSDNELVLAQRGREYSIKIAGHASELMTAACTAQKTPWPSTPAS